MCVCDTFSGVLIPFVLLAGQIVTEMKRADVIDARLIVHCVKLNGDKNHW